VEAISGVIMSKKDYINMSAILNGRRAVCSGIKGSDMTGTFIAGRNDGNSCYTTVAWICIPVHTSTVIPAHFS
jgi:hypothetical protein